MQKTRLQVQTRNEPYVVIVFPERTPGRKTCDAAGKNEFGLRVGSSL